MNEHRTCPYCHKPFLPRHIKQIYCRPTHKEMACRRRKEERGDIRIVKVCPFSMTAFHLGEPSFLRCYLEVGHQGDHLIRVPDPASVLCPKMTKTG